LIISYAGFEDYVALLDTTQSKLEVFIKMERKKNIKWEEKKQIDKHSGVGKKRKTY
jgi:hypothetical protein